MRYEVTFKDGWKIHVNASSPDEAARKAQSYNRLGGEVESVCECSDLKRRDFE